MFKVLIFIVGLSFYVNPKMKFIIWHSFNSMFLPLAKAAPVLILKLSHPILPLTFS